MAATRINPFLWESHLVFQKPPPDHAARDREGSGTLGPRGVESKVLVPALSVQLCAESTQDCSLAGWTLEKMVPTQTASLGRACRSRALGGAIHSTPELGLFSQATSCSVLGSTWRAGHKRNHLSRQWMGRSDWVLIF